MLVDRYMAFRYWTGERKKKKKDETTGPRTTDIFFFQWTVLCRAAVDMSKGSPF